jgi:hypothetical protein
MRLDIKLAIVKSGRPQYQIAQALGVPESTVELSEGITPPAGLQNRACLFRGTRLLS